MAKDSKTSTATAAQPQTPMMTGSKRPSNSSIQRFLNISELVEMVLEELALKDLAHMQSVCKLFRQLTVASKTIGHGYTWKSYKRSDLSMKNWIRFKVAADSNATVVPDLTRNTGNGEPVSGSDLSSDDPAFQDKLITVNVVSNGNELWRRVRVNNLAFWVRLWITVRTEEGGEWEERKTTMGPGNNLGDVYDWLAGWVKKSYDAKSWALDLADYPDGRFYCLCGGTCTCRVLRTGMEPKSYREISQWERGDDTVKGHLPRRR